MRARSTAKSGIACCSFDVSSNLSSIVAIIFLFVHNIQSSFKVLLAKPTFGEVFFTLFFGEHFRMPVRIQSFLSLLKNESESTGLLSTCFPWTDRTRVVLLDGVSDVVCRTKCAVLVFCLHTASSCSLQSQSHELK